MASLQTAQPARLQGAGAKSTISARVVAHALVTSHARNQASFILLCSTVSGYRNFGGGGRRRLRRGRVSRSAPPLAHIRLTTSVAPVDSLTVTRNCNQFKSAQAGVWQWLQRGRKALTGAAAAASPWSIE